MPEPSLVKHIVDFFYFMGKALYDVPLEISIGSAIILTFIWLMNEIFGRLSLWRNVLVSVWALVLIDLFLTPLKGLGTEHVWFLVIIVGTTTVIVGRKLAAIRKGKTPVAKCPRWGLEFEPTNSHAVKLDKKSRSTHGDAA
jgi:hypothetical protein